MRCITPYMTEELSFGTFALTVKLPMKYAENFTTHSSYCNTIKTNLIIIEKKLLSMLVQQDAKSIASLFTIFFADVRDKYDRSALHLACEGGNLETVQYLVGKRNCDFGKLIIIILLLKLSMILERLKCKRFPH